MKYNLEDLALVKVDTDNMAEYSICEACIFDGKDCPMNNEDKLSCEIHTFKLNKNEATCYKKSLKATLNKL